MEFNLLSGELRRLLEETYFDITTTLALHKYNVLSYLFMLNEMVTEESQPNPKLFFDIKDMHDENKLLIQRLIQVLEKHERDGIPPPIFWLNVMHLSPLEYFRGLLKVYDACDKHIDVMMNAVHALMWPIED